MARFHLLALVGLAASVGSFAAASATTAPGKASHPRQLVTSNFDPVGSPLFGTPAFNTSAPGNVLFGETVALSSATGTTLVVGAPLHDYSTPFEDDNAINEDGGAIFLYQFDAATGEWNTSSPAWFLAGDAGEGLGEHLSLNEDGTRIAIRRKNQSPHVVQVYDLPSGNPVGPNLTCDGGVNGETVTLSPDGSRIAMSCRSGSASHVEIYEELFGTFFYTATINGPSSNDLFGFRTAFAKNGTRLAITAPNYDSKHGLLRVFDYDGNGWVQVRSDVTGLEPDAQMGFAMDISADGETIAVSSPGATDPAGTIDVGSVTVFSLDDFWGWYDMNGGPIRHGVSASEKLGRTVALSADGNRLAVSSWLHDERRGQVLLFDYDDVLDVWAQVGAINGNDKGDRLGRGLDGISLTSDGTRIAAGETWTKDNSDNSTGRVLVLDYAVQPLTTAPTAAPSAMPSLGPSDVTSSPTNVPTISPTTAAPTSAMPSQPPSDSSTTAPVGSPTAAPSPATSAPTSATASPTSVPTILPTTAAPSAAPSSGIPTTAAPSSSLDKFDWDLQRVGPITVRFAEETDEEEVVMTYQIHRRNFDIQVFESDCDTPVNTSVIAFASFVTSISGTHDSLEISLDIKQDTVIGSPIFSTLDAETGQIDLCTRVDLVTTDGTSVVFHEQKLSITLNLANGFTVSAIDLERLGADEEQASVDLEYGVTACQCNDMFVCQDATLTQNTAAFLCVQTASPNIEISGIRSLTLKQGGLTISSVSGGLPDDFSKVYINPSGDGKKAVVETLLLSSFFTEDDPANILASGTCTLTFVDDSGNNRLLRAPISFENRALEGNDAAESNFGVELVIATGSSESSGASVKGSASMALMAMFAGVYAFI